MKSRPSTKQIILNYLREKNDWIPTHGLVKVQTKWGWIGVSGRSRVQELAQEGKVERKVIGKYAYFRAVPIKYQTYVVLDSFGKPMKTIQVGQEKLI